MTSHRPNSTPSPEFRAAVEAAAAAAADSVRQAQPAQPRVRQAQPAQPRATCPAPVCPCEGVILKSSGEARQHILAHYKDFDIKPTSVKELGVLSSLFTRFHLTFCKQCKKLFCTKKDGSATKHSCGGSNNGRISQAASTQQSRPNAHNTPSTTLVGAQDLRRLNKNTPDVISKNKNTIEVLGKRSRDDPSKARRGGRGDRGVRVNHDSSSGPATGPISSSNDTRNKGRNGNCNNSSSKSGINSSSNISKNISNNGKDEQSQPDSPPPTPTPSPYKPNFPPPPTTPPAVKALPGSLPRPSHRRRRPFVVCRDGSRVAIGSPVVPPNS